MTNSPPDQKPSEKRVATSFWRPALFVLGWVCLVVGVAGLVLPLLPGTVFLIVSAACFTRSSPRFEKWLVTHPMLGRPIVQWRNTGAIPRRIKWIACASLAASWLVLLASEAPWPATATCFVAFCAVAAYILRRPDA